MERDDLESVIDDIRYLAERQDASKIRTVLLSAQPADIAQILVNLDDQPRHFAFAQLDAELASDVLPELDDYTRRELVPALEDARLTAILDEMESDEAAEVVAELPEPIAEMVLDAIGAQDSAEVRELLQYEEETAGRIMQLELVAIPVHMTVEEAIVEVRRHAEEVEKFYNVYVVDAERLVGLLPLANLVLAQPDRRVGDVMITDIVSVYVDVDQEEVAQVFKRYNLVSLPVVDRDDHLLGRITVDDILDIVEDEASEDIHRMAGLGDEEEYRETSALRTSRARMPWLLVGLCGGIMSAIVLAHHEESLQKAVGLAFFVPVIMGMGGNSGFQSATIVIRGLATGEIGMRGVGLRLLKELRVAVLNGTLCASVMVPLVGLWRGWHQGVIIGCTLIVVVVMAAAIGALVPFLLHRLKIDPSLATGPFITSSNDILALLIYLTIAVNLS